MGESNLHCVETLIDKSKCKELKIVLPPSSVEDLGLIFEFDALCGMPALVDTTQDSPLLQYIPLYYIRRKHFAASINKYETITASDVVEHLSSLQTPGWRTITISLLPADKDSPATNYELYQNYHDSMIHQVSNLRKNHRSASRSLKISRCQSTSLSGKKQPTKHTTRCKDRWFTRNR